MEILNYPYRPKPWRMLLGAAFFGAIAVFMVHEATTNERGLIINGLIRLGPDGATTFYWCIAAISAVFVAIAVPAFVIGLRSSHRLILTSTDVSAPKFGFSRRPTTVKLSDIKSLDLQVVQQHRFLNIHHANGKLTINASFLPNEAAFDELCTAIASRTPAKIQV